MMNSQANLKKVCVILVVATIVALIVHLAGLAMFNQHVNEVHGNDSSSASYMEIDPRQDSTSSWVKRDYDLYGKTVDITGSTIDGTLHNSSDDTIESWTLRINIVGDCLINQAWNGEVEIHQFVGTANEKVQRMNLQDYNLEDVKLEYQYDGDLLIPLKAGDYVLYFPSEKFKEMPLGGNDSIKIGVIFYYLDSIDLSDYDLEFQYHRTFTQGPAFYLFFILLVFSIVCILVYKVSDITYKRAQGNMQLRKSSISSLSDMYAAIYILDIVTDDMTPVTVDERVESKHLWSAGARSFLNMIASDAATPYKSIVSEFLDIDTLAKRLQDRNSVACEFISNTYGWSSMRFFAMDRVEGKPIEKVVCTVQDINEEKRESDEIEQRISKAESESKAKGAFLTNMSQEIRAPINEMLGLTDLIIEESGEESIREHADDLRRTGDGLLMLVDSILDYSELEAGRVQLVLANYSLKELLCNAVEETKLLLTRRRLAFELDVAATTPDGLLGDAYRLRQVIENLIINGAQSIETGSVTLSVFSKAHEGKVHLLVSVKAIEQGADEESGIEATGSGTEDEGQLIWLVTGDDGTGAGVSMSFATGLLSLMGSELKTVRSNNASHECYFEIEQEIVDATPVGEVELGRSDGEEGEEGR